MKKTIFGVTIAGASALLLGFIFKAYDFSTYSLATTTFLGFVYGIYNKLNSQEFENKWKDAVELSSYLMKVQQKDRLEIETLEKEINILKSPVIKEEVKVSERRKRTTKNTK